MELHSLKNITTKPKSRKRVGCGPGSGRGKTSTRGQKGQKSRTGSSQRPGFESGHIPLYRRLPTRGFNNANFRTDYAIVNIRDFNRVEGGLIDRKTLIQHGLIRPNAVRVKILGHGMLDSAFTVKAEKISNSARQKIETAGGKISIEPLRKKSEPHAQKASDSVAVS